MRPARCGLLASALLLSQGAGAHSFGRLYNLPVPFWLYAWACAAVLLLSFILIALLLPAPRQSRVPGGSSLRDRPWVRALARLLPALRASSLGLLLLCIATGWFGSRDPFRNFSMTGFWVIFVLGVSYLTAVFGNLYAALNPWRVLADALGRVWPAYVAGRCRYPPRFGDWPALLLYLLFIWVELFGVARPRQLASLLLGYSALNLVGVWLIGTRAWFRHGEFFSVFLRLMALMAPVDYRPSETPDKPSVLRCRAPFAGLVEQQPPGFGTLLFALAMLSTTAFDGLRATQWWVRLFWNDPTGLVSNLAGTRPLNAYASLRPWYVGWETFCLFVSPFLYLALYLASLWLGRRMSGGHQALRPLALRFGYTLLPIALAYHLAHYATLLLTQAPKILSLASDPFGFGWNLFGTAALFRAPYLPGMGLVWHTQVGFILAGHVVSAVVAHRIALELQPTRRLARRSQLPMLGLMVLLTVSGLWILAQPLTVELMR